MNKKGCAAAIISAVIVQSVFLSACSGRETQIGVERMTETVEETKTVSQEETTSVPEETQGEPEGIQAPHMTIEEYPSVDGSTATIPLSTALYQLVTGATQEEAQAAVEHTKTTNAYRRLMDRGVDLVIAYEPAQSVYDAIEESGQELNIKPIGKDALVFMANEGNPVTSLTGEELLDIYTGRCRDWSEVGGEHKEIIAFQRPENSGSQTLMEKLVMKGIPMAEAPQTRIVGDMGELIEQVASYNNEENALGYSVYFYARNMYQKPGLRFMAVDGIMPSNDTIKKGDYPYVNEFYAAVRADEPKNSAAYELFQWLTTKDGQALMESLGYVGMEETGHMAADMMPANTPVPGTVTLKKGSRILIDGSYIDGAQGTVVLDENLAVEQTITDKSIKGSVAYIKGNEAVAMKDTTTDKWGIYNIEEKRWVIEPVYDYLNMDGDGSRDFNAYKGSEAYKIIWNEEKKEYEERAALLERVGDFWWQTKEKTYHIFRGEWLPDEDAVPVKTLDFTGEGMSYGYASGDSFVITFEDGCQEVYNDEGELIFGEAITGRRATVYELCPYWVWAADVGSSEENNSYIYNYEQGKIVTLPGDQVEITDGLRYACVTRDGEKIVLDENGEVVRSSQGKTFDLLLGNGFCGKWEGGTLTIENPVSKKRYEVECQKLIQANMLTDKLILIYHEKDGVSLENIYLEEQLLAEGEYISYYCYGDIWDLFTENKDILITSDGEIIYEGKENERIIEVNPDYLVLLRGNYLCITDYEGNCGFQALYGSMGDD